MTRKNDIDYRGVQIVVPGPARRRLKEFLLEKSADGREAYACMLCGSHDQDGTLRLLARHLFLPDDDCFTYRSSGGVELKPVFDDLFLGRAEVESLVPVQVHTHPHSGQPEFSPVDDRCEHERSQALSRQLAMPLASCVFDNTVEFWRARYWHKGKHEQTVPLPMQIVSSVSDRVVDGHSAMDPRYDRQVRAFGADLQSQLDRIKVGIVGLGGTGNIMVEGLSRLGVRHFVLVDPDHVALSNLNRMIGATPNDAAKKLKKTKLAFRNIRKMHGKKSRVEIINAALPNLQADKSLAGCDILVAATDDYSSRLHIQKIGSAFLRPVINIGVGLAARDKQITHINGRVGLVEPWSDWCLYCGGHIDPEQIVKELADKEHRNLMKKQGYLVDTPNPAVFWINMQIVSHALSVFHQVVMPFIQKGHNRESDVFLDLGGHECVSLLHGSKNNHCMICGPDGIKGIGDALFSKAAPVPVRPLDLIRESSCA